MVQPYLVIWRISILSQHILFIYTFAMDHWIWTFYPCEPWGLYIIITRGDLLAMYDHMSFTFLRSAYACSLHASSLCCYPINCFFAVDILGFHSHTCVYWPCMPSSCHTNGSIITSLVMVSVNYLGGVTLNVSSPFSGVVISGAHFYYISPLVWHVAIDGYRTSDCGSFAGPATWTCESQCGHVVPT